MHDLKEFRRIIPFIHSSIHVIWLDCKNYRVRVQLHTHVIGKAINPFPIKRGISSFCQWVFVLAKLPYFERRMFLFDIFNILWHQVRTYLTLTTYEIIVTCIIIIWTNIRKLKTVFCERNEMRVEREREREIWERYDKWIGEKLRM